MPHESGAKDTFALDAFLGAFGVPGQATGANGECQQSRRERT
ncbi:hypothetical protein [Pyxidicoccus trucidator]|nr:hypothetical protein [Pyxidicoccus trucidator]